MPLAFISHFKDVTDVIDFFEIEIANPSQSSLPTFTFSNYKSCNRCKFLISLTPYGHIQFISRAFHESYSDMNIVMEFRILSTFIPYA